MAASSIGLGGHTFLPYPQAACREIENHLVSLATLSPSFEATMSPFTHDDGRDAILVNAAGALPVTGAEVSVWLLEAYPHVAPLVFLTPLPGSAAGTTTRPAYVDGSGAVTAPYLRHWRWPDSDLVGLVQSLDVLVRLHDQPLVPREPRQDATAEAFTDSACDTDTDTDIQRALRAVQDDKDRLAQELRVLSIKEAELLDAVAAEQRAVEREEAEDALDRALQAGSLPLCRYLKEIKDVARAQFKALPVPDDLLARPEQHRV
ncbi:unnamed protein product [Urochloa humidicola]